MSGETVPGPPLSAPRGPVMRVADGLIAAARGFGFCWLALAGLVPLAGLVLGIDLLFNLGGPSANHHILRDLLLAAVLIGIGAVVVRWQARLTRKLARQWCGVVIESPYQPAPHRAGDGWPRRLRRTARWLAADPATWRDLLWTAVNACGGWLLAVAPAVLTLGGLLIVLRLGLGITVAHPHLLVGPDLRSSVSVPDVMVGTVLAGLGIWAGPVLLASYGKLARTMLGPTRRAELAFQVSHLARTRSDTLDAGAAQLRKIERDLHDGAQARLVAMGMTLEVAEQLVDANPAGAKALLAEARASSAKALAELRNLVRGIHPPVLADRGLAEALRALALDSPVRARLTGDLAGRPPAPVESAAYFAVSELLANVAKHADASAVLIDLRHERGALRIGVTDDGVGGLDPARGTGLRGIERRIAAFDGVLAASSPPGGPTVVSLEIPCALS